MFLSGVGFGAYLPAYFPLLSVIVPPRIRTQAYGYSLIIIGGGGVLGAVVIGSMGENQGYRFGVAFTAAIVAASGLVAVTAGEVRRTRSGAGGEIPASGS